MRKSPPVHLLVFVYGTSGLALAALVLSALLVPLHVSGRLGLEALELGLAVLCARRFPVHLTDKTKTTVVTIPLVAASLLLPAPIALLVAAAGTLSAEVWRHSRYFQGLFNSSVAVLQTGAGVLLFTSLAGRGKLASLLPQDWLLAAVLTALAIYVLGMLLVETIVSIQLGRLVVRRFWERTWLSLPQEGLLSLLGLLLALVLVQAPWAVVFLPAPAWLVYRSLRTMAHGLAPTAGTAPPPAHLAQLPRRLQLAIVATCACAAVAGLAAVLRAPDIWPAHRLVLAGLVIALGGLSYKLPVKPAPKRAIVFDTAFTMAILLALQPGAAVVVVALTAALGNVLQRRAWFNTLFNVAQQTLAVLAASVVYHGLAPIELTRDVTIAGVIVAGVAAVAFWLLSCLLVDGITAVQLKRSPFPHWLATHRQSLIAHAVLLPLGVAVVPVLAAAPWLVAVLILPALVVRVLIHTALQLDAQAELLVDDLLIAVAPRQPCLPETAHRLGELAGSLAAAYGLPAIDCRRVALTARLAACADALLPDEEHPRGLADGTDGTRLRLLRTLLETPTVAEALEFRRTAYDGSSDPAGPRGAAIPLPARILALCDGWLSVALARHGQLHGEALLQLVSGAGKVWDPELVGLLARVVREQDEVPLPSAA